MKKHFIVLPVTFATIVFFLTGCGNTNNNTNNIIPFWDFDFSLNEGSPSSNGEISLKDGNKFALTDEQLTKDEYIDLYNDLVVPEEEKLCLNYSVDIKQLKDFVDDEPMHYNLTKFQYSSLHPEFSNLFWYTSSDEFTKYAGLRTYDDDGNSGDARFTQYINPEGYVFLEYSDGRSLPPHYDYWGTPISTSTNKYTLADFFCESLLRYNITKVNSETVFTVETPEDATTFQHIYSHRLTNRYFVMHVEVENGFLYNEFGIPSKYRQRLLDFILSHDDFYCSTDYYFSLDSGKLEFIKRDQKFVYTILISEDYEDGVATYSAFFKINWNDIFGEKNKSLFSYYFNDTKRLIQARK